MGELVSNYHLYPQDNTGKVLAAVEFLAYDDTAALEIAQRTSAGQPCELWNGLRLVTRIKEAAH